jgi:hypothetical protein
MGSESYNAHVGIEQGAKRGFVKSGGEFDIESGGALKIAGTQMTASAAELNKLASLGTSAAEMALLAGAVGSLSFAPAAGGANVCEVTIQAKDAAGDDVAVPVLLAVWLSDAETGLGLTATGASGTVQAKSAAGHDFAALTAKKALIVQTLADGSYVLEITDSAKTTFYVAAQVLGGVVGGVSAQLETADYGSAG